MADRTLSALLFTIKARLNRLERRVSPKGFSMPAGVIMPWAGTVQAVPAGWVLCDGALYQTAEQGRLFAAISTKYGQEGAGTFRVPDLRSRAVVGVDTRDADFNDHGKTGGTKAHTLTVNQMPSHNHGGMTGNSYAGGLLSSLPMDGTGADQPAGGQNSGRYSANYANHGHSISSQGGGQSHPNMQPYMALNYIIKL